MYKAILAASVAIGLFSIPAAAKPTSTEQTTIEHVVKKKKTVKKKRARVTKAAKVAPEHNPFLKNESTFSSSHEQSSAQYWAEERDRQEKQDAVKVAQAKIVPNRDQKRKEVAMKCGWFTCEPTVKGVVAEAKKWEGKNARKDKKDLKKLFADTGQEPIDPVNIPWCAAFANAILRRTEIEGTDSLMARSFLTWGAKTVDPKEGDVVVLKRGRSQWAGHVGFFIGYEWIDGVKYVKVLGGNQNKEVNVAYFPASHVIGYRTVA
jgi:uncharacterized protein (TIGR02594 family)